MRFLLLNQFYPPDPAPTGLYLHGLARHLARRGHHVTVICSRRSYDGGQTFPKAEMIEGVEVQRLPATGYGRRGFIGKLSDYASFYGSLSWRLAFTRIRPDVILSLTTPPYIGLLGKFAASRHRCRHAHWIMDLYPDVMFAHGMARKDGLMFRMLQRLTRTQVRGAHAVISLGPMMAERVAAYSQNGQSIHPHKTNDSPSPFCWFPLWSDGSLGPWPEEKPNPLRIERGWKPDETVFLYSGNMGLGHRFGEFMEAANRLGLSGPRWVFSGGGKRKGEVEQFAKAHPNARIEFLGYVPHSQLQAHLCAADVHLASLDAEWQGLMVPSKLQGSFAVARPVLYVGGRRCETAAWIEESGGGWVVGENDVESLLAAIRETRDPKQCQARGQAAYQFARKRFLAEATCAQMADLLEGSST